MCPSPAARTGSPARAYRSNDAGETFALLSDAVAADVVALAETKDGVILVSDRGGLLANADGDEGEWVEWLAPPVAGRP